MKTISKPWGTAAFASLLAATWAVAAGSLQAGVGGYGGRGRHLVLQVRGSS